MTIAEEIRQNAKRPLDDEFKSRVKQNIVDYFKERGLERNVIFSFNFFSNDGFSFATRCRSTNVYDDGNHDVYYQEIKVPTAYESKMGEIEEWLKSEGFKRVESVRDFNKVIGKEYFKENYYFEMA